MTKSNVYQQIEFADKDFKKVANPKTTYSATNSVDRSQNPNNSASITNSNYKPYSVKDYKNMQ